MHRWNLTPPEWRGLGWEDKHLMIAYLRAKDTMQAWENYMNERELEDLKRRGKS